MAVHGTFQISYLKSVIQIVVAQLRRLIANIPQKAVSPKHMLVNQILLK